MNLQMTEKTALAAITALRMVAMMEAGLSQAPNLVRREDTEEWQAANRIRKSLDIAKCRVRQSNQDKQKQGS